MSEALAEAPSNVSITTERTSRPTDYRTAASQAQETWILTRRWRTRRARWLPFVAAFWNLVAISLCVDVVSGGAQSMWDAFPAPWTHLLMGIAFVYVVVAVFRNATVISIDDYLTVRHGPMPWPGNLRLPVREIGAILVQRRGRVNGQPRYVIVARGQGTTRIAAWLEKSEADYMADAVSRRLGLGP